MVDTAATLDLNGHTITVQIGDGTYGESVALRNVVGFAASGNLIIQGNTGEAAVRVIFDVDRAIANQWMEWLGGFLFGIDRTSSEFSAVAFLSLPACSRCR